MIIPQYTIRWMLGLTAVCAVIFSIFAAAMRGNGPALGISFAIVSLVVVFLVHAGVFGAVWLFSVITGPFRQTATRSPFAVQSTAGEPEESKPVDDKDVPASPMILD